ncbi:MAG: hypothetical protein ACTIMA_01255 [Brachybacterium tyrofermentans]|uniref:hypothetical protein n=1 Tax=Brachybacterium tyrofermentans TaxID=47848 RepID=UPI000A1B3AB6|nr:hypothetical protein FM103_12750 [Corynebacterium xerosis]
MIYRLGFWTGPVPADDESACADLHTRIYAAEYRRQATGCKPPPVPEVRRFVDAVLAELPESAEDPAGAGDLGSGESLASVRDPADLGKEAPAEEEACPWGSGDVAGTATAEVFLPRLRGPHRRAIALLTQIAHEHGLHGFDLAAHRMLSMADAYWVDEVPSTDAILGVDPSTVLADLSASRERICRGPELARRRLASAPAALEENIAGTVLDAAS